MANINSVITYNANLSPAQAQIKALTGQVTALTAAFNTLDKSALSAQRSLASTFAANVGQIGGFTTQTVKATTAVETFGKQLAANKLTMREYFREAITGYTRQNSMLRQLAAQQVRYQQSIAVPVGAGQAMMMTPQSINAASSAAQLASQRFSIFNQLVNGGATAMLNWGKNTQWAGRQLMVGFTLPLALFAGVMSKQFRELDKELTRFQKVYGSDLGNAISESTQRMREEVKQLAYDISSTYGIAAKETAALAADIAATGREGEDLMASVQQTTRLAVLGEVDRQEAMKATLSLQSAFRMNTNELAESINFLNAVENQTSATLEDLATAIPKVGPVIRSLGGDVKDLATLLVAMREGGIPAAEAANALKSGLASLINPTKQASAVAKQFGVDLVGIVEANRGQLMPTIFAMQDALNGLDSFSRSRIIEQIFGKYQFARISALFDNIGRTGSQTQSVIELATKSSAELAAVANGEIRTLTESTAVKFQRTLEQLKNALMPIGQVMTESLIPVFEKVGQGLKAFSTFFSALPDSIQGLAKWAVALTAIAGPVIMLVGLFGNLIANGLKFGMMIVRMGAKIAGLKTEKFQLLDEQVMAAKLGVDNLTTSFATQEVALNRLVGVIGAYEASLRRLSINNPALFIPGAVPPRGGTMPIRRQAGSTRPEFVPGSGRGDKIPAMLEPGEFIVNRAATEKYAPVLMQMNRGSLPGFVKGGSPSGHISLTGGSGTAYSPYTMFAPGNTPSGFGMSRDFFETSALFEKSLRASAMAAVSVEKSIMLTRNNLDMLSIQTGPITQEITDALRLTAQEMQDAGQDVSHISQVMEKARPRVDRIISSISDPKIASAMQKLMYPTAEQAVRGGNVRSPAIVIDPATKQIVRSTQYSNRTGEAASFHGKVTGAATFLGVPTSGGWTRAHLDTQKISLSGIPLGGGVMGASAEIQAIAKKALAEYTAAIARAALDGVQAGTTQVLKNNSPSKAAKAAFEDDGRDLANGAMMGLQQGYSQVAKRNLGRVSVGGTGIESISNAQKIAQADQSILRFKTLQQKATADRVRAEVELGALDARLLQIRNSETMTAQEKLRATLAINQERIALERTHQTALANETRIQNIINGYKEKIASADQAQLRAEQEEARNAARRAAGSIGIGPGGGAGWLMGGVSPYSPPKPASGGTTFLGMPKMPEKTGPGVSLSGAKDAAVGIGRGNAIMNASFMASMLVSSAAMMGGASSDAAAKLGLFTTALMTATMAAQMFAGKNVAGNFLGMKSLGGKMLGSGAATRAASMGGIGAAARGGQMGGAALLGAGRVLSVAGGPIGIAAALGITAAITGFMMYRKAADEARERAIAAFNDPVKSAEYFGETITNISELLEKNRLSNISEDLTDVDKALREAVSQDYGPLIEQIKYLSAGAGAQALSVAYSNMIISGMSAENAKAAIEAIAAEAGIAGGEAFTEAVAQGFLDQSLTIKQAIDSIISQFKPSETTYGKTEETIEDVYTKDISSARDNVIKELKQTEELTRQSFEESLGLKNLGIELPEGIIPDWIIAIVAKFNPEVTETINKLNQLRDRLNELNKIDPNQIPQILDSLIMAYQQDPTAAIDGIKEFADTINSLEDEGDRIAALDKVTDYLRDNYGEQWGLVGQSIDNANEKILAAQMLAAGLSLDRAVSSAYEFDSALAQALITAKLLADEAGRAATALQTELTDEIVSDIEDQRRTVETEIQNIENANDKLIRGYNRRRREKQEEFEQDQENSQASIDSMQDEMDQRRRLFDEEMQQLDDRRDSIEKSSEAYINSLEKNQKAESFYAQQRKTAFGALEKLASGDVFGFLQERQQMSTDAQEFSYDQMISGIEERRDLELDAIDEVREKKQREQDEYEQMMQDRIKAEQDLMDEQQKAHDNQMAHYDKQIKKAEREKDRKITLRQEEIAELNEMQEVASRDILEFQKEFADKYEKYDQYARQLENLKILRTQEIYFRGGVPLSVAANRAGIPASEVPDFLDRNRNEFAFEGTSPGGGGSLVIPGNATVYVSQELPAGPDGAKQVRDMTVDAEEVTLNGDIIAGGINLTPGAATGGYIQNGRVNLQDGGGAVKGPGGPKSDVIPAMLSNGEYVIQASSVNKYGTDLMHSINAGKFSYGGYVSADRAETAAQGNRYGGITPQSQVSNLASSLGSKFSGFIPPSMKSKEQKEPLAPLKNWGKDIKVGMASSIDALLTQLLPPFMRTRENTMTPIGQFIGGPEYMQADSFDRLMSFLNIIPFGALLPRAYVPMAYGGYVSADRAETAAQGNRYGGKPKPQYSGGTPTYSGGYTSANAQAYSKPNLTKPKKINTPSFKEEVTSVVDSIRGGLATAFDSVATGFIPPWMRTSENTTTSVGRFIGGSQYNNYSSIDRALLAMGILPFGRGASGPSKFEVPAGHEISVNRSLPTTLDSIYKNRMLSTYFHPLIRNSGKGTRLSTAIEETRTRLKTEKNFLGIPSNAPWQDRPVYGYLRTPEHYLEGYGNVTFDLNPDAVDRVTTNIGDSFNYGRMSRPENLKSTHTVPETKDMRELHIYSGGMIPLSPEAIKRSTLRINDPWHNKVQSAIISPDALIPQIKMFSEALEFLTKMRSVEIPGKVLFNNKPISEFQLTQLVLRKRLELRAAINRVKGRGKDPNVISDEALMANGGLVQKFADGGLVQSMEKYFPNGGHQFYPGWNRFNSWSGGKPGLVMMHHTAGNWGQGELDYFAKNWVGKPVVQGFIRKTGTAHTLAGGNTGYGAGTGSVERLKDVGAEQAAELISLGGGPTSTAWQIEVQSLGDTKDFTSGQFDSIARMTAAIRDWAGWPSFKGRIINHRDWTARKPDTLYDRSVFEANAEKIWEQGGGETSENNNKPRKSEKPVGPMETAPRRGLYGILSYIGSNKKDSSGTPDTSSTDNTSTGNVTFSNIPDGYTVEDANRTLGYIRAGGWPTNLQRLAWSIAMRESGGRNIYDTGDYGIFQLNKPSYGNQPWWTSDEKIQYDPIYNSTVAYRNVSQRGSNFLPWAMRIGADGSYSWDWSYYNPRPSWANTTERRTAAFWNSWQNRAAGGFISGPGGPRSDMIPAMLSNGEYVVKASSVSKYGKGFMDQLNSGQLSFGGGGMIPKYADGGIVGSTSMPAFNMPEMASTSVGMTNNNYAGNTSANSSNTNVRVVINGAGGKNANAIANKVISMINSANSRRNHSRSI